MSLFLAFMDLLLPPREDETVVRSAPADECLMRMCPRMLPDMSNAVALLSYHDTVAQSCVREAKFYGNARATRQLARVLAEYLTEFCHEHDAFQQTMVIIIPMPLSRERMRERGYNQVERIVREALRNTDGTWHIDMSLLVRIQNTVAQTTLSGSERRQNMKGAFATRRFCDPKATYILVDDVLTTGSTIREAVNTLCNAGARNVLPIIVAH